MSSAAPRISVVICSYNRADYIINAIDSLARHALPPDQFEVIAVDTSSKDNTESLVLEYIAQHPQLDLTYLLETRQGASYARSTAAVKRRRGFICFIDDDAGAERGH